MLSDPQFGMWDSLINDHDGSEYQYEHDNLVKTFEKIDSMNPPLDFAVILGDMVNQQPYGAENPSRSHGQNGPIHNQQVIDMNAVLETVKTPIFVIPGNHDLGNTFNSTSLETYIEDFGAD